MLYSRNINFNAHSGIIMCMRPANERWRYIVTPSLIGWAHIQNDPTHSWVVRILRRNELSIQNMKNPTFIRFRPNTPAKPFSACLVSRSWPIGDDVTKATSLSLTKTMKNGDKIQSLEMIHFTWNVACCLVAIIGATILVLCRVAKFLRPIWGSGTCRFNLKMPNI